MTANEKIPWKRLSVEAAAIVGSILLAFAIDAWWEDSRNRQDEREFLQALGQEFAEGLVIAEESEQRRSRAMAAQEALLKQAQGEEQASDSQLYLWLSHSSYPFEFTPPQAVFDDLLSSGRMILIQSDEIRIMLARYERALQQVDEADARAWAVWEQRIQPFLEGRIPRVERLKQGLAAYESGGSQVVLPLGQSVHNAEFDVVLGDPAFEDMIAERWLRLRDGLLDIRQIQLLIQEITDLIDSSLE